MALRKGGQPLSREVRSGSFCQYEAGRRRSERRSSSDLQASGHAGVVMPSMEVQGGASYRHAVLSES